ncbi:helix-turn-helix domain-containing protein [Algibacter mikhailovii]|uniref:helix-turn-helix domain-containing protein n=1 Tax=Algibacter mikhailovii TaxID=425498 RepID=UPI002494D0CD|nr:helix-turn-helix domain-containing protein [Algibacter mikhailovii]
MSKIIVTTKDELMSIVNESFRSQREEIKKELKIILNPPKSNNTVKEVAQKLNVTELTVRNYISKGFIKADKIGRRIVISSDELAKSLKEVKSLKYRR